jgi:8-oxo-dGTP pyrophosphatase MutT (NUDIX family)
VTQTIRAAGILFVTPDKRALFLKRSEYGDFQGHYDLPGGKQEDGETAVDAAKRECAEEIGFYPPGELLLISRRVNKKEGDGDNLTKIIDYTTFIQEIENEFTPPRLDEEHLSYKWAPLDKPPKPLHPGLAVTIKKYFADELGIAELMAEGELTSPQKYGNITLFNMRITGTGLSYRSGIQEYVWRDSSIYLNDRFLKRSQGLPIIFEHPKSSTLTTKEYVNRNVGSVFIPYIKDDEVWGIVKIWDDDAAHIMENNQLSTSPCVVLTGEDEKIKLGDGSALLVEGIPKLLDHLAVCFQGVWDKMGPPKGIETTTVGDLVMADDDKAAAIEAARKADEDKKKADAEEEKKKVDAIAKAKADEDEEWKKRDAKMDAVMTALADEAKRRADKQARKDAEKARRDMDEEERKKADAKALADAQKAKADAEAKAKADAEAKAKADADAVLDAMRKSIADVASGLPKRMSDADYAAMADAQVRADPIYSMHGGRAPRAMDGETLIAYRRRMANDLKVHSPTWKNIDLKVIADDEKHEAFSNVEKIIYADAEQAGLHPVAPSEDFLREIIKEDVTGRKISEFVGRPSAWMNQFAAPKRRLVGIRNA